MSISTSTARRITRLVNNPRQWPFNGLGIYAGCWQSGNNGAFSTTKQGDVWTTARAHEVLRQLRTISKVVPFVKNYGEL